jgi:energy-converting hydrogenase A subunit R
MAEILFTDGEGPIVYKDLAQDIAGRIEFWTPDKTIPGRDFYAALSLYDDYCAEVGMEGYQAGDTLALLAPHLLHHNISDAAVLQEAADTAVINGVEEYVGGLIRDSWGFRIISTAYRPMWNLIGERLGIPPEHIACTELDLASLGKTHNSREFAAGIEVAEQAILPQLELVQEAQAAVDGGSPVTEVFADGSRYAGIRKTLDNLYWEKLPATGYQTLEAVSVVGGRRKVEAAQRFARDLNVSMEDVAYTGDSITDDKMHEHLLEQGGLPIAVNGNAYALRNAFAGVATSDMRSLRPVLDAWSTGGREAVTALIANPASTGMPEDIARYHLLHNATPEARKLALAEHKQFRIVVRGAITASLG